MPSHRLPLASEWLPASPWATPTSSEKSRSRTRFWSLSTLTLLCLLTSVVRSLAETVDTNRFGPISASRSLRPLSGLLIKETSPKLAQVANYSTGSASSRPVGTSLAEQIAAPTANETGKLVRNISGRPEEAADVAGSRQRPGEGRLTSGRDTADWAPVKRLHPASENSDKGRSDNGAQCRSAGDHCAELASADDKEFSPSPTEGSANSGSAAIDYDDEPDNDEAADDDVGSEVDADGSQLTLGSLTMADEDPSVSGGAHDDDDQDDDYNDYGAYVIYGQLATSGSSNSSAERAPIAPLKEAEPVKQAGEGGASSFGRQSPHFQVIFFAASSGARHRGESRGVDMPRTGNVRAHQLVRDEQEAKLEDQSANARVAVNGSSSSFKPAPAEQTVEGRRGAPLTGQQTKPVHYIGQPAASSGLGRAAGNQAKMKKASSRTTTTTATTTTVTPSAAPDLLRGASESQISGNQRADSLASRSSRRARAKPVEGAKSALQELEEDDVKWLNKMNEKSFSSSSGSSSYQKASVSPLQRNDKQTRLTELGSDPHRAPKDESANSTLSLFKLNRDAFGASLSQPSGPSSLVKHSAQEPNQAITAAAAAAAAAASSPSLINFRGSVDSKDDDNQDEELARKGLDNSIAQKRHDNSRGSFGFENNSSQTNGDYRLDDNGGAHLNKPKHNVNYWHLIWLILPLGATFGNLLVIMAVYLERSLQSVTNYFIVSLAFADLFVGLVVMPFAVYVLVSILARC